MRSTLPALRSANLGAPDASSGAVPPQLRRLGVVGRARAALRAQRRLLHEAHEAAVEARRHADGDLLCGARTTQKHNKTSRVPASVAEMTRLVEFSIIHSLCPQDIALCIRPARRQT